MHGKVVDNTVDHIQLFRERLSGNNAHATILRGDMGYDQYAVPDT